MPRRPFALVTRAALASVFVALAACATSPRPAPPRLTAPERAPGADAFPRWDAKLADMALLAAQAPTPWSEYEAADSPLPESLADQLAPAFAKLGEFTLAPGETFVLPAIHGPETPFPHHQPLRHVASARTLRIRLALAAGDQATALRLARENLAQARVTMLAQEGMLPLIHATGVWQCALDGVHALARSPALSPDDARALLDELQADATLAQVALDRALRGEYFHVYKVIVERMPATDDPDLALSSVASLGMAPPEPLEHGEVGLGLTTHPLLDPAATLAAYQADLAPYLAALALSSRFPRELYPRTTAAMLGAYRKELGAFYDYAGGEGPVTLEFALRARAALEATPNPVGKLLAVYLTPQWEMFIVSTLRREAQRSALAGLLAWRVHGRPAPWDELVAAGVLPAAPADPFSDGPLRCDTGENARVWSIHFDGVDNGGEPVEGNTGIPPDLVWLR